MAESIEVEDDSGFTRIITPIKPSIKPNICLKVIFSFNQKKAIIIVLNAVVALSMARIFESAPKLPKEKSVKGIALFVIANNKECFHENFNNDKYFFLNKIGRNTVDAIINRAWTNPIAPNSGAAIFININALPHMAPKKVKTNQYFNSISCV